MPEQLEVILQKLMEVKEEMKTLHEEVKRLKDTPPQPQPERPLKRVRGALPPPLGLSIPNQEEK